MLSWSTLNSAQDAVISSLLRRLYAARTFEDAAVALLGAALDVAKASLSASPYNRNGRILRAVVHLRPSDGYLHLMTLDAGPNGVRSGDKAHLPSAQLWRVLRRHNQVVACDAVLGVCTGADGTILDDEPFHNDFSKNHDVTHICCVPLRAPGGNLEGMLTIDAVCTDAIGVSFVWDAYFTTFETIASIAVPYLMRLPATRVEPPPPDPFLPVIGPSMAPLVEMLRVFAKQEETILISGPTGAGKSRIAFWCHQHSRRLSQPFELIDLATIPEELQMADLFGWRRGAFTGAESNTKGAIARAEGGTLFIDEIDKLSLKAQAGLLRLLEDKQYRPLGGDAGDRKANVRVLIGTNTDLMALTQEGRFREDLYYRINVLPIRLPGLADRKDEIIPWARYMLARRHKAAGVGLPAKFSDEAEYMLQTQNWPGNLRQLDNIVRRAYALTLVNGHSPDSSLTIDVREVAQALDYENPPRSNTFWSLLEQAADAFIIEAERRFNTNEPQLDLDQTDVFTGLVLEAAKRRLGDDEKDALRRAFILLGKRAVVENRNHMAIYRRETEKVARARAKQNNT